MNFVDMVMEKLAAQQVVEGPTRQSATLGTVTGFGGDQGGGDATFRGDKAPPVRTTLRGDRVETFRGDHGGGDAYPQPTDSSIRTQFDMGTDMQLQAKREEEQKKAYLAYMQGWEDHINMQNFAQLNAKLYAAKNAAKIPSTKPTAPNAVAGIPNAASAMARKQPPVDPGFGVTSMDNQALVKR